MMFLSTLLKFEGYKMPAITTFISFELAKEIISLLSSIWGVCAGFATILFFIQRKIRRDRAISSEQIHNLSSELVGIGNNVRRLETEKALLEEKLMQMSFRNFEHVLTVSKQARSFIEQQIAIKNLGDCFSFNSSYLAEVSATLARVHLEAFYSNDDIAQLKESERFSALAVLVDPKRAHTCSLRSEIAMVIASNPASIDPCRSVDDAWDEALEFIRLTEPNIDDEQRFITLTLLGTKLRNEGHYELAGAALRAAYSASERFFGALSVQKIAALNNVATNFDDRDLPELAKPIFEELVEKQQNIVGYFDELAYSYKIAATACDRKITGDDSVLVKFESLVSDGIDRFGPDNRWVLKAQNSLALCLTAVGRRTEAEQLYRETIKRETQVFGSDHCNPLYTRTNLAVGLMGVGRKDEAIIELTDVLKRRLALHGADHPYTKEAQDLFDRMQSDNTNVLKK